MSNKIRISRAEKFAVVDGVGLREVLARLGIADDSVSLLESPTALFISIRGFGDDALLELVKQLQTLGYPAEWFDDAGAGAPNSSVSSPGVPPPLPGGIQRAGDGFPPPLPLPPVLAGRPPPLPVQSKPPPPLPVIKPSDTGEQRNATPSIQNTASGQDNQEPANWQVENSVYRDSSRHSVFVLLVVLLGVVAVGMGYLFREQIQARISTFRPGFLEEIVPTGIPDNTDGSFAEAPEVEPLPEVPLPSSWADPGRVDLEIPQVSPRAEPPQGAPPGPVKPQPILPSTPRSPEPDRPVDASPPRVATATTEKEPTVPVEPPLLTAPSLPAGRPPADVGKPQIRTWQRRSGSGVAKVVRLPDPRQFYPEESRIRGEEGATILEVCTNSRGRINDAVRVVEPSGYQSLDAAAIRMVRSGRFEAIRVPERRPQFYCALVRVTFKLDG